MTDLERHIEFVNRQTEFHAGIAKRLADQGDDRRAAKHTMISEQYRELSSFLEANANRLVNGNQTKIKRLNLTWDEVQDLPPEMIAELSVTDGDKLEFDIIQVIEDAGGAASLDRILLELYRRTGEVTKRTWLNNRLYRMVQKEAIHSVPGKKGVYSLATMDDEEAKLLI